MLKQSVSATDRAAGDQKVCFVCLVSLVLGWTRATRKTKQTRSTRLVWRSCRL